MSMVRALVGGMLGGALGAAAWTAIAHFSHHEFGIVAWSVGIAVGAGVAWGTGRQGKPAFGVLAALLAFASIFTGKLAAAHLASTQFIHGDNHTLSSADAFTCFTDKVAMEYQGVKLSTPRAGDDYPPEVVQAAKARWDTMSPADRDSFAADWLADRRNDLEQHSGFVTLIAFIGSMSPYDLLWTLLAVGTAFRMAAKPSAALAPSPTDQLQHPQPAAQAQSAAPSHSDRAAA